MKILVAGDSTAVGTGAANAKDSIAGRLAADFPDAAIQNVSENGLTLSGLIAKLSSVWDDQFDLIVFQIGANDVIHFTSLNEVRANLRALLDWADRAAKRNIVMTAGNIGLAPRLRWPISWIVSWRTRLVRTVFMEEIGRHQSSAYVDLFREAKDEPFNADIARYYAPDLFHPSGEGYGIWYAELKKKL